MTWPDGPSLSPIGVLPWVPLFSATTQPIAGGVGVIRAQLLDPTLRGGLGGPAAWAVLEAGVPGQPAVRSIADAEGRVALLFPYPAPPVGSLSTAGGSPLSPMSPLTGPAPAARLSDQLWTVPLRAAYRAFDPVPRVPDLTETRSISPRPCCGRISRARKS